MILKGVSLNPVKNSTTDGKRLRKVLLGNGENVELIK
jgi:hypothetical protein